MSMKYDPSWNSVLVTCTECPYWYALRLDRLAAYLAGEAHAIRVHDVPAEIADAARRQWEYRERKKRHAADTPDSESVTGPADRGSRGTPGVARTSFRYVDR